MFGALLCLGAAIAQGQDRSVSYTSVISEGAFYHAVVGDFRRDDVAGETVVTPKLTPAWSIIGNSQPVAAITGTFFAWENQKPVAEVLVDGELVSSGRLGSIVAFDWFGKPHILDAKVKQEFDWFPYRYALRGAVRIMNNGVISPYPQGQGFRDARIWGSAARTGVGLTADRKLILAATTDSVQLSQLARALKQLGAVDAISLDGGGSTMLYYRGSMLIGTGRPLNNLLVLHERSPFDLAYQRHVKRISASQAEGAVKGVIGSPGK